MSQAVGLRNFSLDKWQENAVEAWRAGANGKPNFGTLEVFTGGGKTLLAITAVSRVSEGISDLKIAVVVPTIALAQQWVDSILRHTDIPEEQIGILGDGRKGSLEKHRVVISVINTASKRLPQMALDAQPLFLIVDECHRAGARSHSKVLETKAVAYMGLSATPDRDEFDDDGEPLTFDEQIVGQKLGPSVFRFDLKQAREVGWLPDYTVHHHGISLTDVEKSEYEKKSRLVDDLADKLREIGIRPETAWGIKRGPRGNAENQDKIGAYIGATSARKDLLYRAGERARIAHKIVESIAHGAETKKTLLFHERRDEAEALCKDLQDEFPDVLIALEHAGLSKAARRSALEGFRSGRIRVLVSVKALVEGIDVPDAEIGISVASTSSVRQRVQSLGRVLRRRFDDSPKHAEMHIIYVAETVDELIYAKADWSDLIGEAPNRYLRWGLDPQECPVMQDAPPRIPPPSEDQEFERLSENGFEFPTIWRGGMLGQEYSVDTRGTVKNFAGAIMSNPQRVAELLKIGAGKAGGRFRVSPKHQVILVWVPKQGDGEKGEVRAVGILEERFAARADVALHDSGAPPDITELLPGDDYSGPNDETNGAYRIAQKRGGRIVRGPKTVEEWALSIDADYPELAENANRVLAAWRSTNNDGIRVHCNKYWDCLYTECSQTKFLARVVGGFAWPARPNNQAQED